MPGGILRHPFLMPEHLSVDDPLKCYHRRPATGEIHQLTVCVVEFVNDLDRTLLTLSDY